MSIETRIEKLEKREESPPEGYTFTYFFYGVSDPTKEEKEKAKKKFLDEHPGYLEEHSCAFIHLDEQI